MNAVGLAEQESGRAIGVYCTSCGRPQLPVHCQNPVDVTALTELHRKAEACCTSTVCEKHDYQLYGWALCPLCVAEGPANLKNSEAVPQPAKTAKRARKAAAQ